MVQVLKTPHTPHAGKLSLVRVLSGRVADADTLTRRRQRAAVSSLPADGTAGDSASTPSWRYRVGFGKLEVATGETLGAPVDALLPAVEAVLVLGLASSPRWPNAATKVANAALCKAC
ncbi:MAG: hypothetical protein HPM95_13365 [Alphaproteobacteria bacterium]|nr:hypothetical protein [Alphaproteobacteria bacterium]